MMTKEKVKTRKEGNTTIKFIIPTHHPLLEKVIDDFTPIIKRLSEVESKNGKRTNRYKAGERYIIDSFERLNLLSKRERQFIESFNHLSHRPTEALLKRYKMTHQDFIEYHHDTLLNFYTSYSECAYQCVNQILNLGIAEKSVSASILKGHKWVQETNLYKYIKMLDKLRNNHAQYRNQTTHQGRSMEIEELHWYLQYEYLADTPFPGEDLKPILEDHKKIRKPLYKWKAKSFLDPIKKDFAESMRVCEALLNDLIEYYQYWTGPGKKLSSRPCSYTIKER